MALFFQYLKSHRETILLLGILAAILIVSFYLYDLPIMAIIYPLGLCLLICILFAIFGFMKAKERHRELTRIMKLPPELIENLPKASALVEGDYQELVHYLCRSQKDLTSRLNQRYVDMIEYYTIWAHQIKTPIQAMRLNLQMEDSDLARKLNMELSRIEQYVEMVLMFLRLDSDTTDYVIRKQSLDDIIKNSIKKFSGEFIQRRIGLEYEETQVKVITDEKWLSFVIEQVLSNALKYTNKGRIAIYMEQAHGKAGDQAKPKRLCIEDTGIGIAPEDLPRIFQKGYTGYNGRKDQKASGIGLYLCRRICDNLGHGISAQSELGKGTKITIDLSQTEGSFE